MPLPQIGKILIILGIAVIVLGVILLFSDKLPFIGKLPGDIHYKRGNFTFYFPIVTALIVSVLLTIILNLFGRGK